MYLSCLKGVLRSNPTTIETLAEGASVSPGGAAAELVAVAHAELVSDTPKGRELRQKFERAIVIVDDRVIAKYAFPDQEAEARAILEAKAREAKAAAAEAEARAAAAEERAKAEAAEARAKADEAMAAAAAAAEAAGVQAQGPMPPAKKTPKAGTGTTE